MQFVADLEPNEDGGLQIMYGIDGRRDLTESTRDELSGYEGAQPVRIGNGAFDQRQNDVYGAVLDSLLLHTRRSKHLPRRLWPLVKSQAEGALASWREPDQGIWEARGAPQHYVSSKLMGWVALDRAAKLAAIRDDLALEKTWAEAADEIRADILEHGVSDRGVLRQHYDTDALDASTLLAAIFGFLPGSDERMRNTVDAISSELTEHGFVLRYVTGETDDGLSGKEGTFLICSFWLVSALSIVGEMRAGHRPAGAAAADRLAARPVRRGVRGRPLPPPRELPAGLLPPGPHRGRGADHPGRPARGAVASEPDCVRTRCGGVRRLRACVNGGREPVGSAGRPPSAAAAGRAGGRAVGSHRGPGDPRGAPAGPVLLRRPGTASGDVRRPRRRARPRRRGGSGAAGRRGRRCPPAGASHRTPLAR